MSDIIATPFDYETKGIERRPEYPPEPVGAAIKIDGVHEYLAWGHPTGNNIKKTEANKIIKDLFKNGRPLMHNAAFDIEVAMEKQKAVMPRQFEDTLFLAYLYDPRAKSLSLKPMAETHLGMPSEEQEELHNWIYENVFLPNGWKVTKSNPLGKYIWMAPGELVGKYAIGDTVRTEKLYYHFLEYVEENGMMEAYNREKECLPIFMDMSRRGLKIATNKLKRDLTTWKRKQHEWEEWIRKRMKTPDLDIASNVQLADAMERTGKVTQWIMTAPSKTHPKGQRSTARENLKAVCNDKKLVEVMEKHGIMSTYISTFGEPWLDSAKKYGRIYPNFNQVRSTDEHGRTKGTRTGRPSSDHPNLLNVPRNQEDPDLPDIRNYIVPDEGYVFCIRDYNQQELRILADYEEGDLYHAYKTDPNTDAHDLVGGLITQAVHKVYPRKDVKIVNFGVVYGMGVPGIAQKTGSDMEGARELKSAHGKALPGVNRLSKDIQRHAKRGNPIVTWGGREYYVEEPKIVKGRLRDFYYKLLNYLIQGSAADCTKEAMIKTSKLFKKKKVDGTVVLQVYDELVAMVRKDQVKEGMAIVKEGMESVEFDVPMLSDGKVGRKSWGEAKDYKD